MRLLSVLSMLWHSLMGNLLAWRNRNVYVSGVMRALADSAKREHQPKRRFGLVRQHLIKPGRVRIMPSCAPSECYWAKKTCYARS